MALTLTQYPLYNQMPVGTDWIYALTSTNITGNYKFKFFVDVYIGQFGTQYIIRLKFSPNALGTGIINMSDIFEQYVKTTDLGNATAGNESAFKGVDNIAGSECPIHCIDKQSLNNDSASKAVLGWGEEYSTNPNDAPTEYIFQAISLNILFFNGMAYNNEQIRTSIGYALDLSNWDNSSRIMTNTLAKFLTDAPSIEQRIRNTDYATLAFLNGKFSSGDSYPTSYQINFYNSANANLQSSTINISAANGGHNANGQLIIDDSHEALLFIGAGIANLLGAGISIPASTAWYQVWLKANNGSQISNRMNYYLQNNDCKDYETIRLTWLNKYGAWDYYNFTKKSIRSTNIKRTKYSKIKGEWNKDKFVKNGYNRGASTLNVDAVENITINSDWFASDDEAAWLEQLFISTEVYILGELILADNAPAEYGKYLTPVMITNKEYVRYTRANDKVAQYEIEIEYSINKRVHSA